MGKPVRNKPFLFLATILFSFAGLQHISADKQLSSCSPFCLSSLKNSIPGEVFAANMETQEPVPTAATKRTESAPQKNAIVHPEVPRIAAAEVKEMLARKADVVIVDTNPADSYDMWHIPTAVNIPFVTLMDNPDKREDMVATLPRNKLIVVYCSCEEGGDSSEVALILRNMDYRRDRVKVLEGGLIQWDAKGYPMIKQVIPE
jgi:rhodanese-related sulfurtransferase